MKPFEMIWEVRQRSVEHFAQERCETWLWRNLSVGGTIVELVLDMGMGVGERVPVNGLEDIDVCEEAVEMLDVSDEVEMALSVLDCRDFRRKGREGMRYVGKGNAEGSEFLRRKDMAP
jgi:hypothetical protein